jgi:hypothetical protein
MEAYRLSGTYGTNGFFLEFQDSGALGTDSSGNGNNFTVNNLTSIDQTTDTPTNNFATSGGATYNSDANFGNPPFTITTGNADANGYGNFEYAVPTGYLSLCTKNLSEVNS